MSSQSGRRGPPAAREAIEGEEAACETGGIGGAGGGGEALAVRRCFSKRVWTLGGLLTGPPLRPRPPEG